MRTRKVNESMENKKQGRLMAKVAIIVAVIGLVGTLLTVCVTLATPFVEDSIIERHAHETQTASANSDIQTTEARQTEVGGFTVTPSLMPTFIPTEIVAPTATSAQVANRRPSAPFIVYDDFSGVLDPIKWIIDQPSSCNFGLDSGFLGIECTSDPSNDIIFRITPTKDKEIHGLEMLAQVLEPVEEKGPKIQIMVQLSNGTPNTLTYTMTLRAGIVYANECLPEKNWSCDPIGVSKLSSAGYHLLNITYGNGVIQFILDGTPITLATNPAVSSDFNIYLWKFETVVFKGTTRKTLRSSLDWIAISP